MLAAILTKAIAINCWHKSEVESHAMWSLYARKGEGIAIQTRLSKLKTSLADAFKSRVSFENVRYLDYRKDQITPESFDIDHLNLLAPFVIKRASFAFEQELRALYVPDIGKSIVDVGAKARPTNETEMGQIIENGGIMIPVDLGRMVDNIFLAPATPKWMERLVQDVLKRYDVTKHVEKSSLDDWPLF